MSTSPTFSKPTGNEKIASGVLAYFRSRLRYRVFSLIIKEFKKSGLSKTDLARRLGKDLGQLSRLFGAPGNMTLDMVSDLLFAIDGSELEMATSDLFAKRQQPPPLKAVEAPMPPSPAPTSDYRSLQFDELMRRRNASVPPAPAKAA